MTMLAELHGALCELPTLLVDSDRWNSVHVTYEPPRVERLWCQWGENRIFLHRIWPTDEQVLYHPHPWPSAVRIVTGQYEHRIGIDSIVLSEQILREGSEYELSNPLVWHSVRPLADPSDSIMVIGKPYEPRVSMPVAAPPQDPLSHERRAMLLDAWRRRLRDENSTSWGS